MLNLTVTNAAPSNVELNATLWDNYARDWSVEKPWIKNMLKDNSRLTDDASTLVLGEEWSDSASF